MYKETYDLQDMSVTLDQEDQELMSMFSHRRDCDINGMVLIRQGDKWYLENKAVIAIRHKKAAAALRGIFVVTATICIVGEIQAVIGDENPWLWLLGFMACILPGFLKVPAEVKLY